MRVGYIQFSPVFGEKGRNLERVSELVEGAEADLLVLPELFSTGYVFASKHELSRLSEPIPDGPTTRRLFEISAQKRVHLVAGIPERGGDGLYNSAVLVSPDRSFKVYRKAHLFREEKSYFRPGDTPFEVYSIGGARVGIIICFDWIFPEAVRVLSLKGAQIICQPSNLILPYCQDAMVTRAIENRVFVVTANRAGKEERAGRKLDFTGRSQVVNPGGEVLIRAGEDEEGVGIVEIDPGVASNKAATDLNDLFEDRRVELYKEICNGQRSFWRKKP